MKDALLLICGAVLGLVLSAFFQDTLKAWLDRRRRLRHRRAIRRSQAESGGAISIAGHLTEVYLVEGDGDTVLEPSHVSLSLRAEQVELPAILAATSKRVAAQLKAAKQTSDMIASWNSSSLVALSRYQISRTPKGEDSVLRLTMHPVDYATFVAANLNLDTEIEDQTRPGATPRKTTLRREFLPTHTAVAKAVREPIPFLANGVGVLLLAFTDDNKVILVRRRLQSRARPGERDVSVVEGISVDHDSIAAGSLNVYAAGVRGCLEELGVEVGTDAVQILAFAVDMAYYQWSFLGLVDLRHTADEVVTLHNLHAKDRWEGKLEVVDADPVVVFDTLRRDQSWDLGLVTAYLALGKKCGSFPRVEKAAERVYGVRAARPPWRRGRRQSPTLDSRHPT